MIYSIGQIQSLLRQVGFPENLIVTMAAIGIAESSGNSNAVNDGSGTKSIEYSVGLFQINTRVHKNYSIEQLKNPEINAKEALRIYKLQGLRAWGAYTDGRYKKYLAQSQAAYSQNDETDPGSFVLPVLSGTPLIIRTNSKNSDVSTTTMLIGGLILVLLLSD